MRKQKLAAQDNAKNRIIKLHDTTASEQPPQPAPSYARINIITIINVLFMIGHLSYILPKLKKCSYACDYQEKELTIIKDCFRSVLTVAMSLITTAVILSCYVILRRNSQWRFFQENQEHQIASECLEILLQQARKNANPRQASSVLIEELSDNNDPSDDEASSMANRR